MIINGNLYGIVSNKPLEKRTNTTNPLKAYAASLTAPAYAPVPVSTLRAYSNISFSRSLKNTKAGVRT
jgi:hypothetical protein